MNTHYTADLELDRLWRRDAQARINFLLWLAECLSPPRWERMSDEGKAVIRAEAAQALRQVAE